MIKEHGVVLTKLTNLIGHRVDHRFIGIIVKNPQIPFEALYWTRDHEIEVELLDNMALELNEVLFAHVLLLRIREQPYHLGEAW